MPLPERIQFSPSFSSVMVPLALMPIFLMLRGTTSVESPCHCSGPSASKVMPRRAALIVKRTLPPRSWTQIVTADVALPPPLPVPSPQPLYVPA